MIGGPSSGPGKPAYAGIVTRTVAFALDLLVLNGAIFAVGLVVGLIIEAFGHFAPDLNASNVLLGGAAWILAFAIYFVSWWSLAGQTPGMRALGIKVLPVEGGRLLPRRGLVRIAGMIIAAIPLFAGYLPILATDRRQGLHDKLARTIVEYVDLERPPAHSGRPRARSAESVLSSPRR